MNCIEPSILEVEIGGHPIRFETGQVARQADAAVLVRDGKTSVLVTVVGTGEEREGMDFFPLTVEYREKMASAGRIPGNFLRREGRISDHEVLSSRLIDRSIRPLFPEGYRREVQVMAMVLSAHEGSDPVSLALLGTGVALHLSSIPFDGPVVGCRSVLYRGDSVLLPVLAEREEASADLMVSVGPQGIVMVEGSAEDVPEEEVLAHLLKTVERLETLQKKLASWRETVGKEKQSFSEPVLPTEWSQDIEAFCRTELIQAQQIRDKAKRKATYRDLQCAYIRHLEQKGASSEQVEAASLLFAKLQKKVLRSHLALTQVRMDGRKPDEIRPIWGKTSWLEGPHGSALFTRGQTQAACTCTLGTARDFQSLEGLFGREERRFLLHYNFPPFSVGEARPLRGPGRREIGHGHLAWRALSSSLPSFETFPYSIRVESDILESNGSSSMATVCGGCLSLLDAGVPLKSRVAGIAMGLIEEEGKITILSDILGDEDHLGDMDFKITGTNKGITALQMDNKLGGLQAEVLRKAIHQAREGLNHILGEMDKILPAKEQPGDVAEHAPQVKTIRIQRDLIGALIGPKGKNIQELQAKTGAQVSVNDEGLVTIYAKDGKSARAAAEAVRQCGGKVKVGQRYKGLVTGVKDFGVFVKIYDSAEGLVHKSALGEVRPQEGEELMVEVKGVDQRGKIRLVLA
ncbi:MAG TPA: polyribonucleotide nucleotidyltransferase [Planctomycetes bacterium]|nr:polyribonucleotide nucleotidyltransferase [Planctomycetota bacterium]